MLTVAVLSGDDFGTRSTKIVQKFEGITLTGHSAGHNELTEKMLYFQAESLVRDSRIVYFDQFRHRFELFRQAIRNRCHVFLNSLPDFTPTEMKQLSKLAAEAGSVVLYASPTLFLKNNLKLIDQVQSPFLADIRLSGTRNAEFEKHLFDLLLLIVLLDQSEFRKVDLMNLPETEGQNLVEIRLSFTSGSVARILLSDQIKPADAGIEVFCPGKRLIRLDLPGTDDDLSLQAEENAFARFMKLVGGADLAQTGLNQLIQAQYILLSLRLRLNPDGTIFGENRFAG